MPRNVIIYAGSKPVIWGDAAIAAPPPPAAVPQLSLIAGAVSSTVGVAATGWSVSNTGTLPALATVTVPGDVTSTFTNGQTVAAGANVAFALTALVSGAKSIALTSATAGAVITGSPATLTGVSAPPPPPGTTITSLTVQSTSAATLPYSATVLPLRGTVPAGSTLRSTDDATMRASVLSTHDDGSAAVVVVAGSKAFASGASTISVQTSAASDTPLTAAAISALVSSVAVDFTAAYGGTATLSSFGTPERTWWANGSTICARYRLPAPTPGSTTLEALIDIHAYPGRALVEVVVENGRFNATTSTSLTKPDAATYTGATVSINGSTVATVSSSVFAEGSHGAFRAWYASGWIGGNPGLRVTQLHTDLQKHPLLFKCDQAATFNMAGYAADAYAPGSTGRNPATNMGGTGDVPSIGALTQWDARALQSGDYRAWNASEVAGLSALAYNINHRDVGGTVPYSGIMPLKCQGSFHANWPRNTAEPAFEVAHQPAVGLMAFISRPSPVFIEVAQKVAVWTGTVDSTRDLLNNVVEATFGLTDMTGVVGNTQVRSKGWGPRQIFHATFMSPDAHPWRAGGVEWIDRNTRYLEAYRVNSRGVLLPLYEGEPDAPGDVSGGLPGQTVSLWMFFYAVTEWHKAASARLLAGVSPARQTALETVANGLCTAVVKWVTEQPNGGWRFIPYRTRIGDAAGDMGAYTTWTAQRAADLSGAPAAVAGPWGGGTGSETTWAAAEANTDVFYPDDFWAALVAAVERSVPNAATAWNTVQANVTNLTTFRAAFGGDPRWGSVPKVLPPAAGFGTGADAGTLVGDVWTPARTGELVNGASYAIVPTGRWIEVSGTRMDSLDGVVKAAVPSWVDYGNGDWVGVTHSWNAPTNDPDNCRAWWVACGGHFDSSNNGIYRFDGFKMAYAVEHMPSSTVPWSAGYKAGGLSSFTGCAESLAEYNAKVSAGTLSPINDWAVDELFWDRQPTSRHTYSGTIYKADTNELVMAVRRLWRYSLSTNQWTYKRLPNDVFGGLGENVVAWYDQVRNRVNAFGFAGPNSIIYNLATDAYVAGTPPGGGTYDWVGCADYRTGDVLTLFREPEATGSYASPGRYLSFNVTTDAAVASGNVQFAGGVAQADFLAGQDGSGMVFVPPLNRYWSVTRSVSGGYKWCELDPTTTPWTLRPLTHANAFPTLSGGNTLVRKRMLWWPAMNAVVWLGSADKNIQIYKVA